MPIVSVSLPGGLRSRLDSEAKRQRRSRSFIVAEAVEEYLARRREQAEFSSARGRTLREGLALSPEDRVRLAEELWQELTRGRRRGKPWTAVFETFDQYERWRGKRGRVG